MMDTRSGTTVLRYYWYLGRYDTRHLKGGDMFVMHFRYLLYIDLFDVTNEYNTLEQGYSVLQRSGTFLCISKTLSHD